MELNSFEKPEPLRFMLDIEPLTSENYQNLKIQKSYLHSWNPISPPLKSRIVKKHISMEDYYASTFPT